MGSHKRLASQYRLEDIFPLFSQEKDSVILESSLRGSLGKYSIAARNPYRKLEKKSGKLWIDGTGTEKDFKHYLKEIFAEKLSNPISELPFYDGAIGYFAYEYQKGCDIGLPECVLVFYDELLIEDRRTGELYAIAHGVNRPSDEALAELEALAAHAAQSVASSEPIMKRDGVLTSNFTKEGYFKALERMIRYIVEGDIYIANMTQSLRIESSQEPFGLYQYMQKNNPAPFSAYLNYDDYQVVCASPERFIKVSDRHIHTRPIKGTRRRGTTDAEDEALRAELQASEKDRSELLMIVDLERNDLNRICMPGTVQVNNLFSIESYATVHHLVAEIEGTLEDGIDAVDILEAVFPGGSITGAPKIRAMEIIEELEARPRGIYTGCIGYISFDGTMDLNIVIRTAVHKDSVYELGVGGGITYESDVEFEYEETLQKAKAFLDALLPKGST